MDLENIGTFAFDAELLKALNQEIFKKGFDKGYDAGFTTALYSIVFASKKKSAENALKYAEDFINGPFADKDAKAKCDELAEIGLDSLGGFDCDESR